MIYCISTTAVVDTQIQIFKKLPPSCMLLVAAMFTIYSQHTEKESYHILVSGRFELPPFLQDQTMIGKHNVLILHSLLVLEVFGV